MRKEKQIVIEDEGRDKGKIFILHEMPADAAEWWAIRAFKALAKAGVDVGDDAAGMQQLSARGILQSLSQVDERDLKTLLDEMWACIAFQPDPKNPQFTRGCGGVSLSSRYFS